MHLTEVGYDVNWLMNGFNWCTLVPVWSFKHHVMKYWGSGGVPPRIILDTWWRWEVSFMLWPPYFWGMRLRYPMT